MCDESYRIGWDDVSILHTETISRDMKYRESAHMANPISWPTLYVGSFVVK
jgi:hypothetical protein